MNAITDKPGSDFDDILKGNFFPIRHPLFVNFQSALCCICHDNVLNIGVFSR